MILNLNYRVAKYEMCCDSQPHPGPVYTLQLATIIYKGFYRNIAKLVKKSRETT